MGIIIAILLAVSVGVSFGAEQSLPGDALYSVKTEVNERVTGWLALSAEAEAEHQANLAIRRLEEAEKLKAEGKLDAELRSELEGEFREHVRAAGEESDDSSTARTKIKSSVKTKGDILGITEIEIENEFEGESEAEASGSGADTNIEIESKVSGDFGELKLEFEDGGLKLAGKLNRANPCVDWKVAAVANKDKPSSGVTFNITKGSTAEICIQVLGEPQEVEVRVPNVSADANISVKIESKTVFSGKIK